MTGFLTLLTLEDVLALLMVIAVVVIVLVYVWRFLVELVS